MSDISYLIVDLYINRFVPHGRFVWIPLPTSWKIYMCDISYLIVDLDVNRFVPNGRFMQNEEHFVPNGTFIYAIFRSLQKLCIFIILNRINDWYAYHSVSRRKFVQFVFVDHFVPHGHIYFDHLVPHHQSFLMRDFSFF